MNAMVSARDSRKGVQRRAKSNQARREIRISECVYIESIKERKTNVKTEGVGVENGVMNE